MSRKAYRPEWDEQARRLCLLRGATTAQLAEYFEVAPRTIERAMRDHESFRRAIHQGRVEADMNVAVSLYRQAMGFEQRIQKQTVNKQGDVVEYEDVIYVPPDKVAAIFWLKNRQPQAWRDRPEVPGGEQSPEQIARAVREALKQSDRDEGLAA